jgi:hypothetical protein
VSVALLVFHFSIGLWNCSDIVALFVFLWNLEVFREFGIIGFSFLYWTLELFHTVGTVPNSHIITNNATLSELFQSPIEKQIILTLSELFQSPIEKQIILSRKYYLFFYGALEQF